MTTSVAPTTAPSTPRSVFSTTVGQKAIMAITGIMLIGYVIAHMLGNLKAYTGELHYNEYAEFLRRVGEPVIPHGWFLWIMRPILLFAVVAHIWAATNLTLRSHNARPVSYKMRKAQQASYASRTMRFGGVVILLFIVYHVLHLTTGTVHPEFASGEVFDNVIAGFEVWYVSAFYILAMLALGLHLFHGVWSMFHTLGMDTPRFHSLFRFLAAAIAIGVTVGNISIPLAVLTGVLV